MPRSQFDTQDLAKIHSKIMTICSYRKYVEALQHACAEVDRGGGGAMQS